MRKKIIGLLLGFLLACNPIFASEKSVIWDDSAKKYKQTPATINSSTGQVTIPGANPIVLDGATPDANKITITVTDPTVGRTLNIPNEDVNLSNVTKVKGSSGDSTPGYLDAKVKNSITIDSNQLQLVNDSASPGNNKAYGTNESGVRGWQTLSTGWVPTNIQVFTSSGTWTKPAGVSKVYVKVVGAGAGGADRSSDSKGGGGGGAGAYCEKICTVTEDVAVTVGIGGTPNNNGGASSFGAFCTANGGSTGSTTAGGIGGTATGGDINIDGGDGDGAQDETGDTSSGKGGHGGASYFGGGGRGGATAGEAASGKAPGSGGGGALGQGGTHPAGSGKNGLVIVYY